MPFDLARIWHAGPSTSPPTTYSSKAARRPHRAGDGALGDRLAHLAELDPTDLHLVASFVDALVTKTRLKALAGGIN